MPDLKVINEYKQVMINGLRHSFPALNISELDEAIDYTVRNTLKNGKASIDNNYTKQRVDGTVLDVLKYIESKEPIITSSGVLFKKHAECDNPLSRMIMQFLDKRAEYKKTMFKYPKGSEMFARYNLLQLLEKINANAVYG